MTDEPDACMQHHASRANKIR